MLFHSSLRKDLARNFGATLVILVTIVMTIILIRTLGQASRGSVNPSEVMLVMGFSVLGQMTTIRFTRVDRNPKLPADTVRFVPPADADVVGDR